MTEVVACQGLLRERRGGSERGGHRPPLLTWFGRFRRWLRHRCRGKPCCSCPSIERLRLATRVGRAQTGRPAVRIETREGPFPLLHFWLVVGSLNVPAAAAELSGLECATCLPRRDEEVGIAGSSSSSSSARQLDAG